MQIIRIPWQLWEWYYQISNSLTQKKFIKMILLHDLAESIIGDFTPDQITLEKKKKLENEAFAKIMPRFAKFPEKSIS